MSEPMDDRAKRQINRIESDLEFMGDMVKVQMAIAEETAKWDEPTCRKYLDENGGFTTIKFEGQPEHKLDLDEMRDQCFQIKQQIDINEQFPD